MLATPYVTMDGINDAGVSFAVLLKSQSKDFADIKSECIGTVMDIFCY